MHKGAKLHHGSCFAVATSDAPSEVQLKDVPLGLKEAGVGLETQS